MVEDRSGNKFALTARGHVVVGYSMEKTEEALDLLTPRGKYSFIQEPVNRLMMHMARKGYKLIEDYLNEKACFADATMLPSGIWYIIDDQGTGTEHPNSLSTVTVHYEGRLLDGTKFDSSYDRAAPSTFSLQNVIGGWQIGIPLFKKEGKGKLIIPSKYG